ncbi:glycosyltransferase family 2 protein [Leptospira ilyithenensis]|uniref:Glycosyltransferase n=1 Tax=Leptospira ilyithenensis TaxID=2484901 RepID=A0A4R9LMG3_9LEPT|nr:glycosyltransferase family 2 protein [Leptospira ilyithenensis]TGN08053.1 glycosyltransferase [Leptospira ilyithenensis]
MKSNLTQISIIAPFYNEESGAKEFFSRVESVLSKLPYSYEIITINDGSRDNTLSILLSEQKRNPKIKVLNFSRNFGKEAGLSAGLAFSSGDMVIPIDSDLQDPPEIIPNMIQKWKEGYEVVYAKRKERAGESWFKKLTANFFYKSISYMSDVEIPRDVGDFRLIDRKVVDAINSMGERNRFMKGIFAWVGFKHTFIEYDRDARFEGNTKWNYWKLWNFALDGILMFSTIPLKIWSYIGFAVSGFAFFYLIFRIIRVLIRGIDVPGYDSTIVIVLFLGGIQLIGIGVLGEYIARVFHEVKQRPVYLVSEAIGFKTNSKKKK